MFSSAWPLPSWTFLALFTFLTFFFFWRDKLFGSDLDFDKWLAVARGGPRIFMQENYSSQEQYCAATNVAQVERQAEV
jgi:hypothetical protein